jgi:hypothetical protein
VTANRPARGPDARAGLCARCRFAHEQVSAGGSRFWRCLRADDDGAFARYPRLPILRCAGFAANDVGD